MPQEAEGRARRLSGSGIPSAIERSTWTSASPSPMQWWIRATRAEPPRKCSMKWRVQSGRPSGKRLREQPAHECLERRLAGARPEPDDPQVVVEGEVGIRLPGGHPQAGHGRDDTAGEPAKPQQPPLEQRPDPIDGDRCVEDEDAGDHHEVRRVVHPEPGCVDVAKEGSHG